MLIVVEQVHCRVHMVAVPWLLCITKQYRTEKLRFARCNFTSLGFSLLFQYQCNATALPLFRVMSW
ncbi:unnamed protein product [Gongylonema pulchrum]|uniref:Secreted protein n=1 Tax=Gongylonema pulchrum TaxID=637853 RepID=A0A183D6H4_9BILA|nr:unnamed protein product [Gongylonema pulchrum]